MPVTISGRVTTFTRGLRPGPVLDHLVLTDTTIEALLYAVEQSRAGVIIVADELLGWFRSMGQYKAAKGNDRQTYLSLWNGKAIIVNRKRDEDFKCIQQTFVSITGCIQPDVLHVVSKMKDGDDGFLDRLLISYPDDCPTPGWREKGVSKNLQSKYQKVIMNLHSGRTNMPPGEFKPSARLRVTVPVPNLLSVAHHLLRLHCLHHRGYI